MLDYENILEAQTKQKIHRTRVFFQLLKLVKKENLKTATELVKEYVKNPEDFNMNRVKVQTLVNKMRVKLIFVSCLVSCRFI